MHKNPIFSTGQHRRNREKGKARFGSFSRIRQCGAQLATSATMLVNRRGDSPSRQGNPRSSEESQRFYSLCYSPIEAVGEQEATRESKELGTVGSHSLLVPSGCHSIIRHRALQARTRNPSFGSCSPPHQKNQGLFANKETARKLRISTCNRVRH